MLTEETEKPGKRPALLIGSAIFFLASAFILTSELLIALGPMRGSLTSDLGNVREIAETEVLVIRVLFALTGLIFLTFWMFWASFSTSKIGRNLLTPRGISPKQPLLNRSAIYMLSSVVAFVIWVALAGIFPKLMPRFLGREDGVFEYLTALLFLCASVLSFLNIGLHQRKVERLVYLLLGVGFLLCVGEEISWGQRFLGFATPENVAAVNVQGEVNLHNSLGYAADHIFIAGVFLFGVILPILAHRYTAFANLALWAGIPVASLGLALGWAAASFLYDWTVYALLAKTSLRIAEFRELISALGFVLLMLEIRKARSA